MSRGTILVITGTGTDVGKTVVTAAIAALAERSVAVLKPAQTGVPADGAGDLAEITRLAGPVTTAELARYPEPLAPDVAARRSGRAPVRPHDVAEAAEELAAEHDLVLVEGAGGLLVRYDEAGGTLADAAVELAASVLVVSHAGLGALNVAALTAEALRTRELSCAGVVIGSWPAEPDLACRCNVADLPSVLDAPLLGALPAGAADPAGFRAAAEAGLAPRLGGAFDPGDVGAPLLA